MDENNNVTEGSPSNLGGISPKPEVEASSAPVISGTPLVPDMETDGAESVRKVENLWEGLDMTPPAPVGNPSYRMTPATDEGLQDASSDRFSATLLFPSQPDRSRSTVPPSDLGTQPAPDPSTRITSLPADDAAVAAEESEFIRGLEPDLAAPPLFAPAQQQAASAPRPQPERQTAAWQPERQPEHTNDRSVKEFLSDESVSQEAPEQVPATQAAVDEAPREAASVTIPYPEQPPIFPTTQPVVTANAPAAQFTSVAQSFPVAPIPQPLEAQADAAVENAVQDNLVIASSAASDYLAAESAATEFVTEEAVEVEEEPVEKGISVITREATVLGDIITDGHIDIVGRVKGNIDAKGDVAIHGIVRGDVGGSKIGLYNCRVKGNLDAGLGVIVDENSIIGGDVKTKNIIFDGKVKGNIDADNVVVLRSHSYCLGDVVAASLAVEPGAVLNGKVRTFVEGDLEAPFDEVL